jgi:hypothetical protein
MQVTVYKEVHGNGQLPIISWIGNAAAVLVGGWGAVSRQAQAVGCSRQTAYDHAEKVAAAVGGGSHRRSGRRPLARRRVGSDRVLPKAESDLGGVESEGDGGLATNGSCQQCRGMYEQRPADAPGAPSNGHPADAGPQAAVLELPALPQRQASSPFPLRTLGPVSADHRLVATTAHTLRRLDATSVKF